MKVLINKTYEVEVDEKFRDMFPMKGCVGVRCTKGCPFGSYQCCRLNSEIKKFIAKFDFTAEIVEDKIDFNKLIIGQKVWLKEGKTIFSNERNVFAKVENPAGKYVVLCGDEFETLVLIGDISLIPPPKKKVTKTVEAWASVYIKNNVISYMSKEDFEYDNTAEYIKIKLFGNYEIEE